MTHSETLHNHVIVRIICIKNYMDFFKVGSESNESSLTAQLVDTLRSKHLHKIGKTLIYGFEMFYSLIVFAS